ncbi:hypothetical protein BDF14DRAFT_1731445 [Spinellus fusiger]|nr:hypothetical protein BDF14DRAFT_1731445 [Spinellus fusiger]
MKIEGLTVFLIDEFKKFCSYPACKNGELEKFKKVQSPRLFRREKNLTVTCHGLLR